MKSFVSCLAVVLAGGVVACGSSNTTSTSPGGTPTATSADVQTAQASSDSADHAGAADTSTASQPSATLFALEELDRIAERAERAASLTANANFTIDGCTGTFAYTATASLGSGLTVNGNIAIDANTCKYARKYSGSEVIDANYSTGGSRTVQVTDNLTATLAGGDVVTIDSNTAASPTYTLNATGKPSDGNVTLTVTVNEHRTRNTSAGKAVYDVSIWTNPNAPLTITNSYTSSAPYTVQTRTIVSGSNTIHHNLAKFTATHTFANVQRTIASCECPSSGSLTQVVTMDDGSGAFTRVYTFTGCGQASVNTTASTHTGTATGTASVTWNNCT